MSRPKKRKNIHFTPEIRYFKPRGIPLSQIEEIEINLEELESLRLFNIEKKSQTEIAKIMNVHQSTIQRTITKANEKITKALILGLAIKINGGNYNLVNNSKN